MRRHIIDQPVQHDDTTRVRAYTHIDRVTGDAAADPKVKAMHRKPRVRDTARKLDEFLQIDRNRAV